MKMSQVMKIDDWVAIKFLTKEEITPIIIKWPIWPKLPFLIYSKGISKTFLYG